MSKVKFRFDEALRLGNVIPIGATRKRRLLTERHISFYLTEADALATTLGSFEFLQVHPIRSPDSLKAQGLIRYPNVILIEAGLKWADPIRCIRALCEQFGVPIVLIYDPVHPEKEQLIKEAYAAGAYETIAIPLRREELFETLEVLLKLQRHISQHH